MKYRTTQPFIAFGKTPEVGDVVELTESQAAAIRDMDVVVPYETRVRTLPENKALKKPSGLSRQARHVTKKTRRRCKKTAKK